MNFENYSCDGQMNLMDFLQEEREEKLQNEIIKNGEIVFRVLKGDVLSLQCESSYSIGESEEETGYRMRNLENGGGDTVTSLQIGNTVFFSREKADLEAKKFLDTHDVILAKDMESVETFAWYYIRNVDGRKMTAFYTVLSNGCLYVKGFMTYEHLFLPENATKALKKFIKETINGDLNKIDGYNPQLKNMYRCKNSDWDYGESGYSMAVG